jgi:hypothetical protein
VFILSLARVSFSLHSCIALFKFSLFNSVECLCYVDGLLQEISFLMSTLDFYLVLPFTVHFMSVYGC